MVQVTSLRRTLASYP